jgi:hypothetical protein
VAKDLGRDRELLERVEDPFVRRSLKTALHLRRYLPFYVFGTIWAITLAAFPSLSPGTSDDDGAGKVASGLTTDGAAAGTTAATDPAAAAAATDPSAAAAAGATPANAARTARRATNSGASANAATAISAQQAAAAIQRGTGKTRLGIDCKPGQLQLPSASYGVPCQNVYDGPNGGDTYRGVTDKEITIVMRKFPDSANARATQAVVERAGGASREVADQVRAEFVKYFNKAFELYGRQVKLVTYESENGNSTNEAQAKGKEGACLDADKVSKELKAFGVIGRAGSTTAVFGECAAENGRNLMAFDAAPYYPESWFKKYHPFMWGGPMECERISYQLSEYLGKRLINKPAKWAGDAVTRTKTRYFGTYIPDNDGYQHCNEITKRKMKEEWGVKDTGPQYNYVLDISRFPDQAAQASVQFSTAGVTTVVLACDAISAIVLTEAATKQNWHPEWMTIGTGLTDIDNAARLYDQSQVDGHLFGPSQLGSADKLIGAKSEPGIVYKQATGNTIPEGTSGDYFTLVRLFSMLQAAGPILSPNTVADGVMTIPPGGAPNFPAGYASFLDGPDGTPGAGDHTAVDDSREVFWVNPTGNKDSTKDSCVRSNDPYYNSPDTCGGTYRETYNGKRFRNGEWPAEDPPIYPPH